MMKYYSLDYSSLVYLRKDSTIFSAIYSWQRISAPILLNTILQMAQLTAFLTSSCSSKSRALSPVCVYLLIFDSPSLVERRSPSKRVAYLRMLTTLQWLKAEASPTHPCSIMLPGSMDEYFFMPSRRPFS